jgi:hypothetical protein
MLQIDVFSEIRQRQRIHSKPICHRLTSVAIQFCSLLGPFARLLASRLRVLSGR